MQIELHPTNPSSCRGGKWSRRGAIPESVRKFGWIFDTSLLEPADLILVRETKTDRVGRAIVGAQLRGGYHCNDARWTHAAMYVGDGITLCEATFSLNPFEKGGVILTPVWEYCGSHIVRVRRPKELKTSNDRWLVAISALTNLNKAYDFGYILNLAFRAQRGEGFWANDTRCHLKPSALVCSTLYADAYTRHTRKVLGEKENGHCTPAYLSQCDQFVDVGVNWLEIS